MSLTSKFQIQDTCPHGLSHHSSERSRGQDDQRPRHHLRHRLRPPRRTRSIPSVLAPPGTTYFYPPLSGTDSPDTDSTPPPDDVYPFEHMPQSSDLAVRALGQPSPTGFRITTSCDDPSGDEEEPSSQEILIDRQQRRHRMDESSSSDDDDEPRRPHRQRNSPRRIEWVEKESKENRKPLHEVLPCVKFFIERKKHVVSMKFDPPVYVRSAYSIDYANHRLRVDLGDTYWSSSGARKDKAMLISRISQSTVLQGQDISLLFQSPERTCICFIKDHGPALL